MYNNENNLIMKTMCPPAYHRSGFVATLGHMMYGLLYMYKYKYIYIYIHIYIYIYNSKEIEIIAL